MMQVAKGDQPVRPVNIIPNGAVNVANIPANVPVNAVLPSANTVSNVVTISWTCINVF